MGHSVVASSWLCATIRALSKRVQVLEQELRVQHASLTLNPSAAEFVPATFPVRPPGEFLLSSEEFFSCSEDEFTDKDLLPLAPPPMGSCLGMAVVPGLGASLVDATSDIDLKIDEYMERFVALEKRVALETRSWMLLAPSSSSPPPIASSFVYELYHMKTHVFTYAVEDPHFSGVDFAFPHHITFSEDDIMYEYNVEPGVGDDEEFAFADLCASLREFGVKCQNFYDKYPEYIGNFSCLKHYVFTKDDDYNKVNMKDDDSDTESLATSEEMALEIFEEEWGKQEYG